MTFWDGRSVFVTGATGLLGSWLVEELLARGATVTTLVRDWVPGARPVVEDFLAKTNVVRGELEDFGATVRALNEYEVETVFHLGAQTIVGTASRSPISTFESNIRGTWTLLEACRECSKKVKRIVVASSDKAYGSHDALPYTEDTPLQGRFPYDVSKSCADLISISYHRTYELPVAITRCGNLFGGGDLNFNRLVPGTIRSALRDESPIIRSDGALIRDYFYVRDAVEAYMMLAEQLDQKKLEGQAFNFGTGEPISVLDLVRQILALTGKTSLQPTILDEATHEIPEQTLCSDKAERVLGWTSSYTIEDGLRETIEWYRARPECQISPA